MPDIKARNAGPATGPPTTSPVSHKIAELKSEGLSADEAEILRILEPVLLSNGTAPVAAAAALDGLCLAKLEAETEAQSKRKTSSKSKEQEGGDQLVEGFLTQLWEILICLMSAVPHDHPAQTSVVALLGELRLRATTSLSLWGVSTTPPPQNP